MTPVATKIDTGMLTFGHLGAVLRFDGAHAALDGKVLIRISHEKRFRTGTFLGLTSVDEYERDMAGKRYFLQRTGIFIPANTELTIELPEGAVMPEEGTAGAAVFENVGTEAYLSGEQPWRGSKTEIIDHFLGEGSSFVYSDNDGMLDPDTFSPEALIEFA